jgi:hypothetical protein
MNSTETILAAISHLKGGPLTCTQMGSALWGKPYRKWQAYARPGGRILHRMKRMGLVERYYDGRHFFLWKLTTNWEAKLREATKNDKD